jgi:hypothetical protein
VPAIAVNTADAKSNTSTKNSAEKKQATKFSIADHMMRFQRFVVDVVLAASTQKNGYGVPFTD